MEFFVNNLSVGTDNQAPYSIAYTIPANGTYSVAAYATDNDGNTSTSAEVQFTVGPTTTCSRIAQSSDDGEEQAGIVGLTSSDLELVTDGTDVQTVGMRFTGLNIPQGATITNAYIQFTVDEAVNDNPCGLTIYGEASDDAATFDGQDFSISGRPRVASSVSWAPSDWLSVGDAGYAQQTPDISAIVQEVVNRNNYTSSSSMAFIIEGGGSRVAESFDGNSTPPELCVSFLATPPDYDCPELSAFIGDSCDDGDNTTIDDRVNSACICEGTETECTGPGDEDGDGVCTGQDCDDSDPYVTTQLGDACDDGNPATINDMIGPGCVCAGTLNDCPIAGDEDGDGICSDVDCNDDDASITQQIGDACDDGNPNTIGETIQADCSCGGGPSMPVQACSTVSNGDDDAEERLNSGRVNLNSSDLELITDPRHGAQAVGLRFNGLNIPQGAIISSARVQFTVDEAHQRRSL